MKRVLAGFAMCLLGTAVCAADLQEVQEYIDEALRVNPGLSASRLAMGAVEEDARAAGALPDPMISYGHFVESVETRVGPQEARIGVSQGFPWFGKRDVQRRIAAHQVLDAQEQVRQSQHALAYRVSVLFYDLLYVRRSAGISRETIEVLKRVEAVARARVKSGGAASAALSAQVELGLLNDQLQTLMSRDQSLSAQLNALLGRPLTEARLISDRDEPEVTLDPDVLLKRVVESNPSLLKAGVQVGRTSVLKELAAKEARPDFVVGLDYVVTGDAENPSMPDSGKDAVMARVGLTLPLWGGRNDARRESAAVRHRAAQDAYRDREAVLEAQAVTAIESWKDATRRRALYKDSLIPQSEQALRVAEEGYAGGKVDFLTVMEAERQHLKFQLALARAQADVGIAHARIVELVGGDVQAKEGDHE